MLLAVDIGNTQTMYGLFQGETLLMNSRIATRRESTADELGVLLIGLLTERGLDRGEIRGMIVSSVVPDLNDAIREVGVRFFDREPLFVGPGVRTGVPILYENPHEVGADRIVNAVAAKARFGAPVIVLDFGTATTFDVVAPGGEYLGGVIAPGLGVSAEALFRRTSRLPRVHVRQPDRVIGRNTEQSIQCGLYYGYAGLVEGLVRRIRDELGVDAPVVATGGLAPVFGPELHFLEAIDGGLTLQGLRLIWDMNR